MARSTPFPLIIVIGRMTGNLAVSAVVHDHRTLAKRYDCRCDQDEKGYNKSAGPGKVGVFVHDCPLLAAATAPQLTRLVFVFQGTGGTSYADQQMIFDDLGQGVLNNAYEGFNSWCAFFYRGLPCK